MDLNRLVALILLLNNLQQTFASISCNYLIYNDVGYSCKLTVDNPNGSNNYTDIQGTHLEGFSDELVVYAEALSDSNSFNVPSIICEKFKNLKSLYFSKSGIRQINDFSFRSCSKLTTLGFTNNSLLEIGSDSFATLTELETLMMTYSSIEELPVGIFSPLVNMHTLWIYNNKLRVIRFETFGQLLNLKNVYVSMNEIEAIDENFIDNTGVTYMDLYGNVCINDQVLDFSGSKDKMKKALEICVENYKQIVTGKFSSTSIPMEHFLDFKLFFQN